MKRRIKRHTPEQIVRELRDAEVMRNNGRSIEEVLKLMEISEATFHRWRNQYGGMKSKEAKRLKDLERENARLKRLLAEAELDKAMLREALRETTEPDAEASGRKTTTTEVFGLGASGLSRCWILTNQHSLPPS